MVGFGALGLVLVGWLAVSFLPPGRSRAILEWLSATAAFAALLTFFASLSWRAWTDGFVIGWVGFGLLAFMFALSFSVSVTKTVLQIRGKGGAGGSATR